MIIRITFVGAITAVATGSAFITSAQAIDCSQNHCYESIQASKSNFTGTDLKCGVPSERIEQLSGAYTGEFIEGECWVMDTFSGSGYIESGFETQVPNNPFYGLFWGDTKPNCDPNTQSNCQYIHVVQTWNPRPAAQLHVIEIIRTANAHEWNVWDGGVYLGTSDISGMNWVDQAQWGAELYTHDSNRFDSCLAPCTNGNPGYGIWSQYVLPYVNGSAVAWDPSSYDSSGNSPCMMGSQNTVWPWVWTWYKQK